MQLAAARDLDGAVNERVDSSARSGLMAREKKGAEKRYGWPVREKL
jgi:hypothetical protein